MQQLNETVFKYFPYALMMAEESSAWPMVTLPVDEGGLGFNYKWNMGWMNDTLDYMESDFHERPSKHHLLTFPVVYSFAENYVLPLSHDEVVHGKSRSSTRCQEPMSRNLPACVLFWAIL